jgi:hypothetical protein
MFPQCMFVVDMLFFCGCLRSDICQLCHAAARSCYDAAVSALEEVITGSTTEMLEYVDEMSALKGTIPTTSTYNTAAMQYTANGVPPTLNSTGGLSGASSHGGPTSGQGSRRSSFITGTSVVSAAPKPKPDIWLCVQRYRQVVRDSQEAMCVLITEHMDLELHMQILSNKVYSLFRSMANSYHQEQTSLWEESLQLFGNLLGDTILRIEKMGRPFPILQSPFAKLQAAEVTAASNPSTPVKGQSNSGNRSPSPKVSRTPAEIQYDDFPAGVGVFSFVVLYRDPLPLCPSICRSGDIMVANAKDFLSTKGDVLKTAIWKTVYAVVTSDGYFHILRRGKSDIPDVSYCVKVLCTVAVLSALELTPFGGSDGSMNQKLPQWCIHVFVYRKVTLIMLSAQRCNVQTFNTEGSKPDYGKVVIALKPHMDTDTALKNGAK